MSESNLEPRVAKVETALEAMERQIGALASAVMKQGENFDIQMRALAVAVTSAAGPRKLQWEAIVSAVGLILAIGASALSPLYLRMGDVQAGLEKEQLARQTHERLTLHPVGETRINAMEIMLKDGRDRNSEAIRELDTKLQKEYSLINETLKERLISQAAMIKDLDERLQKEFQLAGKHTDEKVAALQRDADDVKSNGSPVTRERLAVLESELKHLRANGGGLRNE